MSLLRLITEHNILKTNKQIKTMEKFMLIVREDLEKIGRLTPEERFSTFPTMLDWVRSIAESGNYIGDRKSTRLNSSHQIISYAVFCLKKKKIYRTAHTHPLYDKLTQRSPVGVVNHSHRQ